MARPKTTNPRNITVPVRFTAAERDELAQAVEASQCSGISDYLRRRALGHRVVSRENALAIAELRKVGGLLKLAITEDPLHAADHRRLLIALNAAIGRLGRGRAD